VVHELLKYVVNNADVKGSHGRTALHRAAILGLADIVSALLKAGATMGRSDGEMSTLLCVAAEEGHSQIVKLALAMQDGTEVESLLKAAECGHVEVVRQLLAYGVDLGSTDEHGESALHRASKNPQVKVAYFLLNEDANVEAQEGHHRWTALFMAAECPENDIHLTGIWSKYKCMQL
jgi:ankyrin repeat protein